MKASELIRQLAENITLSGERLREVDVVYREGATCIDLI